MKRRRLLVQLANNQTREIIQERLSPPVGVSPILPEKQNELVQVAYEVCMEEPTSDKVTIDELQNVEILETEEREKSLSPSLLQNSEYCVENLRSIDNTVNEEQPNDGAIGDFSASDTDDDYHPDPAHIDSSTDSDIISTSVLRQIPVLDNIDSERLPKKRIRNKKNWTKNKRETKKKNKKRDLISLCTANLIPQCHHSFYESLKTTNNQENESGNSDDESL